MDKLHRQADVLYKTNKRIYSASFYAIATITLRKLTKALEGDLIEEVPDDDSGYGE